MQRDYGFEERCGDAMQNVGVNSREHERADQLPREERVYFGLNDAVLRRREVLNQWTDENGFAVDEEN